MSTQELIVKCFNIKIAEKNLKQKDVAKSAGMSDDRLSRILSLKSKMLAEELLKLCFILSVDPNDFKQSA